MQLLDPKIDIVFKLLFSHPDHRDILISLLTAVLRPKSPIAFVEVLNPEMPKELPDDKGAVLDVHVRLADGRHVDVEMQSALHSGLVQRLLFYWAKLYTAQLHPGDTYRQLCPCISVTFLNDRLLPTDRLHSIFRTVEVNELYELSDALELHIIELPKLQTGDTDWRIEHWARFLLARSEAELQELAMTDSDMLRAKQALDTLSQDPAAQELARQREMARANLAIIRGFEREEGRTEGLDQGLDQGLARGLRHEVATLARVFGLELDEHRRAQVESMSAADLEVLIDRLTRLRSWPPSE